MTTIGVESLSVSTFTVPQFKAHHRMALALVEAKVTPVEMAERLGIAKGTVYAYMSGARTPKLGMIKTWAAVCGVPWEWLQTGELPPDDESPGNVLVNIRLLHDLVPA